MKCNFLLSITLAPTAGGAIVADAISRPSRDTMIGSVPVAFIAPWAELSPFKNDAIFMRAAAVSSNLQGLGRWEGNRPG